MSLIANLILLLLLLGAIDVWLALAVLLVALILADR